MSLFGLEEIRKKLEDELKYVENCVILLSGSHGCGKKSLIRQLKIENTEIIKIDKLKEIENIINNAEKDIVFYLPDIDNVNNTEYNDICIFLTGQVERIPGTKVLLTSSSTDNAYIRNLFKLPIYETTVPMLSLETKVDLLLHLLTEIDETLQWDRSEVLEFCQELKGYSAGSINTLVKYCEASYEKVSISNLKEYMREHPIVHKREFTKVYWSDIGGYKHVKNELRVLVQNRLKAGKKKMPHGILLRGPPGCSKTMFAHAIATECQYNFFPVFPDSVLSKFVGDSENNLKKILMQAEASPPAMIFFDEIDLLFPGRHKEGKNDVTSRLLIEMLVFMDDVAKSNKNVQFVFASNNPKDIDEALIRPGRIDLDFQIALPDKESREEIIKIQLNKHDDDEIYIKPEVLSDLADCCHGFSGASIVMNVNAALYDIETTEEGDDKDFSKILKSHFQSFKEQQMSSEMKKLSIQKISDDMMSKIQQRVKTAFKYNNVYNDENVTEIQKKIFIPVLYHHIKDLDLDVNEFIKSHCDSEKLTALLNSCDIFVNLI